MIGSLRLPATERRILGGAPLRSITPWIVAVMSFTIVLAGACGLLTASAAAELGDAIGHRYVLMVPGQRGEITRIAERLRAVPGVRAAEPVAEAEMRATLRRWLGSAADSTDLPVPALVKLELANDGDITSVRGALLRAAPGSQLSSYRARVGPLLQSLKVVQGVAFALVALLTAAASSAVVLAARGSIDSHRSTVDVLHGIGAADEQIARLFQHRIALDTLVGSFIGAAVAGIIIFAVGGGARWAAEMSGLGLRPSDLMILVSLPFLLTIVATLAARAAIFSALRGSL